MKRPVSIFFLLALLLCLAAGMTGCGVNVFEASNAGSSDESPSLQSPEPTPSPVPDPTPLPSPSPEPAPPPSETPPDSDSTLFPDNPDLEYADLAGLEFWFCSGAGAWRTTVTIQSDGTFIGNYIDSDAGSREMYECNFSGQFSPLVKTGDYEYSMHCESLTAEGTVGEERIEDGITIITADPYGFDDADEFSLYLPGKKLSELPEAFIQWAHGPGSGIGSDGTLTAYGLYNAGGEQGFIVYP